MHKIAAIVLGILLCAIGYGWWRTNPPPDVLRRPGSAQQHPDATAGIDQSTFALSQRLAGMAEGSAEQNLAETAQRLADHELDAAFAAALRQIEARPPVLSAAAQTIQHRLEQAEKQLDAEEARVNQLIAAVGAANDTQRDALQNQLDLSATQLELDKDEVEEANQDLLAAGGNQHQRLQTLLQKHSAEARVHPGSAVPVPAPNGPKGMVRGLQHWRQLRLKLAWLAYARREAEAASQRLATERQQLSQRLESSKASIPALAHHTRSARAQDAPSAPAPPPASNETSAKAAPSKTTASTAAPDGAAENGAAGDLLATTRLISADQKLLTFTDQRRSDLRELAGLYAQWSVLTDAQATVILHQILESLAIVVLIVMLLLFIDRWLERLLGRTRLDRRQIETLRSITRVALQIIGLLIIVLIVIGVPGQLGTMIGLAGAGLTVALKDFIVAFIGWLVLMGRNGVRLGDWVEINGVTGEVVELGMFHTVLLETGNWTDAGQPTGRRVTFTNSFAIEKHYFNFSTAGQWLWDEVVILVPFDRDPNVVADAITREVAAVTAASASQAEQAWRRAARSRRDSTFSAAPGESVRPALGGIEVSVRYITRASERFQLRSRLYQSAVRLLSQENPSQSRPNQKGAT
jgi:small-conductance mechanosensitive channel